MSLVYSTHVKSPHELAHIFMYGEEPCELVGTICDTELKQVVGIRLRIQATGNVVEVLSTEFGFPGLTYALKN